MQSLIRTARSLKPKFTPRLKLTLIAGWMLALLGFAPIAFATNYDAQINALKDQINQNQSAANQKRAEADTLANKVAALNAEIAAAQNTLNLTRTQISKTESEIAAQTAELAKQQNNMRESLRSMYKERDVTPLEVLASSDNLSDFVGKQQYMQQLKDKIDSEIASIKELTIQLQQKKADLADKAEQEKGQVNAIAAKRSEQQSLLAQTKGQEAAYQQQVAQNKTQLNTVLAAQQAELRRLQGSGQASIGGSSGGGYPGYLCNAPQDSIVDPWRYLNRECVSYAAWKRSSLGRMVPVGWGNAGDWYDNTNSSSPGYGDIVVWPYGTWGSRWGHVAIVESVNGGMMTVSQYNFGSPGSYSTMTVPVGYLGARYIK